MNQERSLSPSNDAAELAPQGPRAPRVQPAQWAFLALGFVLLSGFVLLRLSAYGIWDPWELGVAESARKLGEGATPANLPIASLALKLVSKSFAIFGEREWAGRLPFAISGVGMLLCTGLLALRFAGARTALYATVALGTTPLFLLHSRQMLGSSLTFFASSLLMLGACGAAFPARIAAKNGEPERVGASAGTSWAWLLVALAGAIIGTYAAGVLLAVVPPLFAVALTCILRGDFTEPRREPQLWTRRILVLAGFVVAFIVMRVVMRHEAEASLWTGGAPLDGAVPTYERALEHVFHGFAPWSALLPVAIATLVMRPVPGAESEHPLRLVVLLWAALGYAAQTLYLSAFGTAPFPAAPALALACALWLNDRQRDERPYWPELTIVLLFLGLIIRDFALYPGAPWNCLEIADAKAPEVFNPRGAWAAVLGLYGIGFAVSCMAAEETRTLALRAPYQSIPQLWRRSIGHKLWLLLAAITLLSLLVFGLVAFIDPPGLPLTTLGKRIGKGLFFLPIALPIGLALAQIVYAYSVKLARFRHALLMLGALAVGGYVSQRFLPAVSEHFSPRDVFDAYNRLAVPGEPLAQHHVEGRAASYYAKGEVRDISSRTELLDFLAASGRHWAAFPSDQLADIDVAFRKRTQRHLYVPPNENSRIALVASVPAKNAPDENPLSKYVKSQVPAVQHKVGALLEDAIELVGYDIKYPQGDHVGPGQSFTITWVWRALRGNIGSYKVFLHIDAGSQRINGDHEPVDGKYPVRLWDEGDVILDRQVVAVPATDPPGVYTLYVGLYRGDSRLRIVKGDKDDADRIRAGTVRVQ
jgi:hypothetical protein